MDFPECNTVGIRSVFKGTGLALVIPIAGSKVLKTHVKFKFCNSEGLNFRDAI